MTPELIAIDWGTSSFRAWLLSAGGQVIGEVPTGPGILAVSDGDFDAAFEQAVKPWLAEWPDLPVIASGMITSRNGWVETPYLPLPLNAHALADALTRHSTLQGRAVHFVTGAVRNPDDGLPDVMRGEETEIIGHLAVAGATEGVFILPGTHSKWARVSEGQLIGFETCMTGEIFDILRRHSILGRLMTDAPANPGAFLRGLEAGKGQGALLARIFSARSLALMERLEGGDIVDYLSGLLIGDEVTAGLLGHSDQVTIIGRGDLAERYRIAVEQTGVDVVIAAPGMARAGLWEIVKMAGIVK